MVKNVVFYRRHARVRNEILRRMRVSAKRNMAWWYTITTNETNSLTYDEISKLYDSLFRDDRTRQ